MCAGAVLFSGTGPPRTRAVPFFEGSPNDRIAKSPKRKTASRRRNDKFLEHAARESANRPNFAFRRIPVEAREELIQEVIAQAYALFVRLCQRARRLSSMPRHSPNSRLRRSERAGASARGATAGTSCHLVPRDEGIQDRAPRPIQSADRTVARGSGRGPHRRPGGNRRGANRLGRLARSLSQRQRTIASVLATGETTGVAARRFRLSPARISQMRVWFRENWQRFHGDTPSVGLARC